MPHLLLIDDDPTYCLQLQEAARAYRFDITFCHNLEDGLDKLISSRRHKAVILDGHCFIEHEQQGAARSNFVYHALQRIADIEKEYNRIIPFCVNSEHPDDFREDLEGITTVFNKAEQHDPLFQWLKNAIALLPETTIRRQYHDVFEKTASRFTEEEEDMLIDVLQNMGTSDSVLIITNLAILRRLLERLIDISCLEKLNKSPVCFTTGHSSRTRRILEAMNQRILPAELYVSATNLYKTCSRFGNHNQLQNPASKSAYFPGKYALLRLVNSYIELLLFLL